MCCVPVPGSGTAKSPITHGAKFDDGGVGMKEVREAQEEGAKLWRALKVSIRILILIREPSGAG